MPSHRRPTPAQCALSSKVPGKISSVVKNMRASLALEMNRQAKDNAMQGDKIRDQHEKKLKQKEKRRDCHCRMLGAQGSLGIGHRLLKLLQLFSRTKRLFLIKSGPCSWLSIQRLSKFKLKSNSVWRSPTVPSILQILSKGRL